MVLVIIIMMALFHLFIYLLRCHLDLLKQLFQFKHIRFIYFRSNISPDPLSFMFILDRFLKFLRFQIGHLSFEFVSDMSFKFLKF